MPTLRLGAEPSSMTTLPRIRRLLAMTGGISPNRPEITPAQIVSLTRILCDDTRAGEIVCPLRLVVSLGGWNCAAGSVGSGEKAPPGPNARLVVRLYQRGVHTA